MVGLDIDLPKSCGECPISFYDTYYSEDPPLMCPLAAFDKRNPRLVKNPDVKLVPCPLVEIQN